MEIKAYAKINICLNVVGKRSDGYHELEMIMAPIDLHDTITITTAKQDHFTCSDSTLLMDEHNTVIKAVQLMRKQYKLSQYFHIHVDKKIPAQAGLAGGSTDGAAVMRGIAQCLNLSIPIEEVAQLGKQIGADVPFCVMQTCALVQGIGERITPFTMPCDFKILLVKPKEGIPTKKAFSLLDFTKCDHPDCELVKTYLQQNKFEELASVVSNSLEYSAFQILPRLQEIKHTLQHLGFSTVLMSGSGSTLFAFTKDTSILDKAEKDMQNKGYFVCRTQIIS